MLLIQRNDVIQQVFPGIAVRAFHETVLPWTVVGGDLGPDARASRNACNDLKI